MSFRPLSIIAAVAVLSGGVALADTATPNAGEREAMKVMNLGNPHAGRPDAADAELEKKLERKKAEELAEWSRSHSRDIQPGMGVGGHQTPADAPKGKAAD